MPKNTKVFRTKNMYVRWYLRINNGSGYCGTLAKGSKGQAIIIKTSTNKKTGEINIEIGGE